MGLYLILYLRSGLRGLRSLRMVRGWWFVGSRLGETDENDQTLPLTATPRAARRSRNQRSRLGESTYSLETTRHGGAARGLAEFQNHVPASARARFSPKARVGEASGCLCGVGGRFRVHVVPSVIALRCPFVPSVIISGCPVCRRWSLPGAICAIGGRFRAPFVPSVVASGRPLCGGRFWTPFVPLVVTSGRPSGATMSQRPHVTVPKCNGAQM